MAAIDYSLYAIWYIEDKRLATVYTIDFVQTLSWKEIIDQAKSPQTNYIPWVSLYLLFMVCNSFFATVVPTINTPWWLLLNF